MSAPRSPQTEQRSRLPTGSSVATRYPVTLCTSRAWPLLGDFSRSRRPTSYTTVPEVNQILRAPRRAPRDRVIPAAGAVTRCFTNLEQIQLLRQAVCSWPRVAPSSSQC